jgi:hypothetical protein
MNHHRLLMVGSKNTMPSDITKHWVMCHLVSLDQIHPDFSTCKLDIVSQITLVVFLS